MGIRRKCFIRLGVPAVVGAALGLSGCATALVSGSRAEDSRRPSDARYLADRGEGGTIEEMDKDLSRSYWAAGDGSRRQVTVIPLTGPLVRTMFKAEAAKLGVDAKKTELVLQAIDAVAVRGMSCFDVFVNGDLGDESKLQYYSLTFRSGLGVELPTAPLESVLEQAKVETSIHRVLKALTDGYLQTSAEPGRRRSVAGHGAYSRGIVCGRKVDFTVPFGFSVKQRAVANPRTVELVWSAPAAR